MLTEPIVATNSRNSGAGEDVARINAHRTPRRVAIASMFDRDVP